MIEKVDIAKIRGEWQEIYPDNMVAGGNDTTQSIKMVANKINEIIEWINEQEAHNIKVKEDLEKFIKENQ